MGKYTQATPSIFVPRFHYVLFFSENLETSQRQSDPCEWSVEFRCRTISKCLEPEILFSAILLSHQCKKFFVLSSLCLVRRAMFINLTNKSKMAVSTWFTWLHSLLGSYVSRIPKHCKQAWSINKKFSNSSHSSRCIFMLSLGANSLDAVVQAPGMHAT